MDIETIFVDSCDDSGDEGFNEMVAFHTGPTAVNTAAMNVNWPSQSWQGLAQNAFTTSKVNALNTQVAALGGCGRFLQPVGGVIPANSKVILITSQNFSLTANVFGAITQDIYILFQDNTTVSAGHFGNYNATSGIRTLTISFGGCSDTVSYDRSLLVDANGLPAAANGAMVHFNSAGVATYTNEGCVAPLEVFSVDAGSPLSACPGATVSLAGTAQGQSSVSWTAPSGSFANNTSLTTNYTIPVTASGSVTLTLTVTNSCGNSISDTVVITVNAATLPSFTQVPALCSGAPLAALPTTSNNGITGTWSPPIDNTQTQTYNFLPTAGQCASGTSMTITVNSPSIINITNNNPACNVSALSWVNWTSVTANSAQGVVGSVHINVTHSVGGLSTTPDVYNGSVFPPQYTVPVTTTALRNDLAGAFTFCFDAPVTNPQVAFSSIGQASVPVQINTSVPYIVTWAGIDTVYPSNQSLIGNEGYTIITFPGTHTCIQFDYLQSESYCNLAFGIQDVNCQISPICAGGSVTLVAHGASNYVWSPATDLNTSTGSTVVASPASTTTYHVTDTTGCYLPGEITVTVNPNTTPTFNPIGPICFGATPPALPVTSLEGISGTWSPAVIDNQHSDTYNFLPNPGQCANSASLAVAVTSANINPDFASSLILCSGNTPPALNTTSPNGISGTWSPSVISNTSNGTYLFTPNPGQCANNFTLTVTVTSASIVPNFPTAMNVCSGTTPPVLNTTSPNGISGTWSPATINNTVGNNYVFTPNSGQCATILTIAVNITAPSILPAFNPVAPICVGDVLLPLPTTSTNGITGNWSPALDNTQNQTYTFTPNVGQCALNTSLAITVNLPTLVPTFATTSMTICSGDALSPLPTTSTNGIAGVWSPALSNTQNQTYTFTPNAGQCARNASLAINVTQKTVPTFNSLAAVCAGTILTPLPTTSLNGISGTWSPAPDNSQTRTYTFAPATGQCATTATLIQTINPAIMPVFTSIAPVCTGTLLNPLPSVSANGISGSWSPSFNNLLSQAYTFTPNPGQCAINGSLNIDVAPNPAYAETAYICFNQAAQVIRPATIDTHLSGTDYTFIWTQDGHPLTDATPSIQASQTGIYEVVATHKITGCTITITTTVLAAPTASAIAYVNEDFADQQQIIVEVSGGLSDFLYQLDYGPYQPSNIFPIYKGGDYTIHVKDVSGCNDFELHVTALNYPKYFTPNDDGYHDTWNVQGLQSSQNGTITIFDRYGKLLKQFRTTSDGWNGTYNGRPLPSTDYWFVIDYQTLSGVSKTFRSHFSLKR